MNRTKRLRGLAWAAAFILGSVLLAWAVIPPLVKSQMESRGSELLGRELRVAGVSLEPWSLTLTLEGVTMAAAAGSPSSAPQFEVARVRVDADLRSLWKLAPVVEAIEIDAPRLRLARLADGRYDIDDIVAKLTPAPTAPADTPPSDAPARFALFNLQLRDGQIELDDRTVNQQHVLRAIQLGLPFLSTLPADVAVSVEPRLAFALADSQVDLRGNSVPFAPDRATELLLKVSAIPLDRWWAYTPTSLPVRPQGGVLAADLRLQFAQPEGKAARIALSGAVSLGDFALKNSGGEPLLALKKLAVQLDDVQPLARKVTLGTVRWEGLAAEVRRDARGQLEWETWTQPANGSVAKDARSEPTEAPASASTASASTGTPAPHPWSISVSRTELVGARVRWSDASVQPAADFTLDPMDVSVDQMRWPSQGEAALTADMRLLSGTNEVARLKAAGQVSDQQAQVGLELADLHLGAAAPYLRSTLAPALSGRARLSARLDWARGDSPRLALAVKTLQLDDVSLTDRLPQSAAGDARLSRLKAMDVANAAKSAKASGKVLAQLASVNVGSANIDLLSRLVTVDSLRVRQPALAVQRDAAGALNVAQWLVTASGADTAAPATVTAVSTPSSASAANPAAPPWRMALKDLLIDGGQFDWADAQVRPGDPVALQLRGIRLSAIGLTWPISAAPVQVQLATRFMAPLASMDAANPPAESGAMVTLADAGSAAASVTASVNAAATAKPTTSGNPRQNDKPSALPPGRIELRGQVLLESMSARGNLLAERLPVHAVEPYFGSALPVVLQRAELGASVDFEFRHSAEGPKLDASGDVLLADVRVMEPVRPGTANGGEELLSWQSLTLKPVRVALSPGARPRVEIGEIQLNDFFSRLTVSEQGRFSLSDLKAPPPDTKATATATATAAPSNANANAVDVADTSATSPGMPLDLVVGGTRLINGRVDFTDRFVRPNYSAALSELNGTLGRLASGTRDMATVDLRGRVAGTGLLEIRGAFNPTAQPLALDIVAKTSDIELAPFSPYAGKYAGYGIERGKLSLDVAYRIDADGKLEAKNQLVLNQLTLGDKTDSPDATKLPVRLALALLTDRNGVIDINLPVSGSLNDPQFSVIGLVFKIIGNLLVKAVTAPFSMFSGAATEDLSLVEFLPGTTQMAPASRTTIDRVAQALADRPALRMTVVGASDPVSERDAMQAAALEAQVQTEQRRDLARAGNAQSPDAALPPLTLEERGRLVKRLYSDARLPSKPRNLVGLAKDLPLAEMEALLRAATVVSTDSARQVALQRGLAVRDALIARGLSSERLFLGAPKLRASGEDDAAWTPRVQLTLAGPS